MRYTKKDKTEAMEQLTAMIKAGDTLYTKVNQVSRSGMSRDISVYIFVDNRPIDISWYTAVLTDNSFTKCSDVRVSGCGMDMGFYLVYRLSSALFPTGFECIGANDTDSAVDAVLHPCPSNDHQNGDRNYAPHHHADGGYALKQAWF